MIKTELIRNKTIRPDSTSVRLQIKNRIATNRETKSNRTEPTPPDPSSTEPTSPEAGSTTQRNRIELNRTGFNRTELNRTEPSFGRLIKEQPDCAGAKNGFMPCSITPQIILHHAAPWTHFFLFSAVAQATDHYKVQSSQEITIRSSPRTQQSPCATLTTVR